MSRSRLRRGLFRDRALLTRGREIAQRGRPTTGCLVAFGTTVPGSRTDREPDYRPAPDPGAGPLFANRMVVGWGPADGLRDGFNWVASKTRPPSRVLAMGVMCPPTINVQTSASDRCRMVAAVGRSQWKVPQGWRRGSVMGLEGWNGGVEVGERRWKGGSKVPGEGGRSPPDGVATPSRSL